MGGLACAQKVITNYGVLAPEATALATPGSPTQQEAAALSLAAMACCDAYTLAYEDGRLDNDGRAKLLKVLQEERADAVKFAGTIRAFRAGKLSAGTKAKVDYTFDADALREHRDKMVGVFVKVIDELMDEYYKQEAHS